MFLLIFFFSLCGCVCVCGWCLFTYQFLVLHWLGYVTDTSEEASDNNRQEEGHVKKDQEKKVDRFIQRV